eukprot:COSAG02_NODE_42392_length_385_cov_0.608392_1_plen_21_part_10
MCGGLCALDLPAGGEVVQGRL